MLKLSQRADTGHFREQNAPFRSRVPGGRGSATESLCPRHATANIPSRTIRGFVALCRAEGITVEKSTALKHDGANGGLSASGFLANLLGEQGVFLLTRERG